MKANDTESVRIDKSVVEDVRKIVEKTKQSIGGFISIEVKKVTDRKLKQQNKVL